MDPDDRTPGGIRDTGAEIITYGAPVLPGAMLLVAYLKRNEDRFRYSAFRDVSCMQKGQYLT